MRELISRNELEPERMVSCIFTSTHDLNAEFPAVAARKVGLDDGAAALRAGDRRARARCASVIRVLVHYYAPADHEPGARVPRRGPGAALGPERGAVAVIRGPGGDAGRRRGDRRGDRRGLADGYRGHRRAGAARGPADRPLATRGRQSGCAARSMTPSPTSRRSTASSPATASSPLRGVSGACGPDVAELVAIYVDPDQLAIGASARALMEAAAERLAGLPLQRGVSLDLRGEPARDRLLRAPRLAGRRRREDSRPQRRESGQVPENRR